MSHTKSFGLGIANDSCEPYGRRWLFSFGAYGSTHVLVTGCNPSLEDALEIAAEWLSVHAPGHLTQPDYNEAAREMGADVDGREPTAEEIGERAESDLTYTESGWLVSHEWYVHENPTREHLLDLQKRHMYDNRGEWKLIPSYTASGEQSPRQLAKVIRVNAATGKPTLRAPGGRIVRESEHVWDVLDPSLLAFLEGEVAL